MNNRLKYVIVTSSTLLVVLFLLGAVYSRSDASSDDPYRHLAVYTEVLHRIKTDYVEEPDMKSVTLGALNGMLESIDPYASYLSADQYKQYLKTKDTAKGNLGLIMSKRFGYVGVIDALPGSAAAKAGLTTGDVIETIGGVSTRDMPLAFAELLMRGDPGTDVELGILRFRKPEPQTIKLTRSVIQYLPVNAKMLPDQVALLDVNSLEPGKTKEIAGKLEDLQKQGAQRIVLDLRNCGVGSPEEGIKVANLFLDNGLITYLEGQKVTRQSFNASASAAITQLPLVVITNRGTAGGAEIAAAALLDDKRADVVGEKTYGDAAMRKAITMDDGSAVILSVAKYYSPNGKSIQDNGVVPSIPMQEVDLTADTTDDDTAAAQPEPAVKPAEDQLLKKAIEVLVKGKQQASAAGPASSQPVANAAAEKSLTPLGVPKR